MSHRWRCCFCLAAPGTRLDFGLRKDEICGEVCFGRAGSALDLQLISTSLEQVLRELEGLTALAAAFKPLRMPKSLKTAFRQYIPGAVSFSR